MPEVSYYFNAYTTPVWVNPDNLVDGDTGTFAASAAKKTEQVLTGNNCPGTDLGAIVKVELRVYAYGDGNDRIDITPVFVAGDGNPHQTTPVVSPGDWTAYVNITNDPNHPDWSLWSHIQDLDCIINNVAVSKANIMYASKVEIRVTYTPEPTVTTQAVADILTTTATGHGTITDVGAENASKRGVCWNTTGNPTVADSKSEETDSFGTGAFSRPMTGLIASTHYYVRAYAYNSYGYGYGDEVEFDTAWEPPVSDIDVGADPIDRPTGASFNNATLIAKDNPANASGILHTVMVYASANITAMRVGTFYVTNGNTLKCRDSVAIGDVAAGFHSYPDLSITVVAGDYIGCYCYPTGGLQAHNTGFAGKWLISGEEHIDPGDEATYILFVGQAVSLYGYGDIVAVPENTVYLVKATGKRTQLSAGAVPIKIDPATGRRGTDPSFPKFLVREDDGTLRAKSA